VSADALARALARQPLALRVLARDVLGAQGRLDAVAADARGRAVAVLRAPADGDRAALVDLLAHVRWLAPRLADWRALAPGLPLEPAAGVGALLLADRFDPRTAAAAAMLGPERLALGLWHAPPPDLEGTPWIELLETGDPDAGASTRAGTPRLAAPRSSRGAPCESGASSFRTGLSDADLAAPPGVPPGG
jgi:hypothetical protein